MIVINSENNSQFSINGVNYPKIYQPNKIGTKYIGLSNIFDSKQTILKATHYTELIIEGVTPTSQINGINSLLDVVYTNNIQSQLDELDGRITVLESE